MLKVITLYHYEIVKPVFIIFDQNIYTDNIYTDRVYIDCWRYSRDEAKLGSVHKAAVWCSLVLAHLPRGGWRHYAALGRLVYILRLKAGAPEGNVPHISHPGHGRIPQCGRKSMSLPSNVWFSLLCRHRREPRTRVLPDGLSRGSNFSIQSSFFHTLGTRIV